MTHQDGSRELHEVISRIYEGHSEKQYVNPAWLATEAMVAIGFSRDMNEIVYLAAHLQFRQLARGYCRKQFDDGADVQENDLFPETLQARYPRRPHNKDADPVYVALDLLGDGDVQYNVDRLRKEGKAKLQHAYALEAWGRKRFGWIA